MPPLHRLPNGSWIDLLHVTAVQPIKGHAPSNTDDRVAIRCGDLGATLWFTSFAAAQDYADSLAALVNEAREKANLRRVRERFEEME